MDDKIKNLLTKIKHKVGFDRAELLNKGHSNARKYILYQSAHPLYLLRVQGLDSYARQLEEYKYIKLHYDNGVSCQKPLLMEAEHDLELCYSLLTYTEGESGEEILPGISLLNQYQQGFTAGEELRKIHRLVPEAPLNWFERRYAKKHVTGT